MPIARPALTRNLITHAGAILATGALASIIFILLVEFVGGRETPYLGILLYLALPSVFVLSLILVPIGMRLTRRRLRRPVVIAAGLAFGFFIFATLAFTALLSGLSYRAYGFMESTEFCGQLCHAVMAPEFTQL